MLAQSFTLSLAVLALAFARFSFAQYLFHGTSVIITANDLMPRNATFESTSFYCFATPTGYVTFGWWMGGDPGTINLDPVTPNPTPEEMDWFEYSTGKCNSHGSCILKAYNFNMDNPETPEFTEDYTIRTTMCAPSPTTGASVTQSDINRRILAGSLEVGAVPDVASAQGGGMSWITADVLEDGIWRLSHQKMVNSGEARFRHIMSSQHILYTELASMLSTKDRAIESVAPEEWFKRLRAKGGLEMDMHAAVVEKWWQSGWVPFKLDTDAMDGLETVGLKPVVFDRDMLLKLVIGKDSF